MRTRNGLRVLLLTAVISMLPGAVRSQEPMPEDPQAPLPLGSSRPDDGGLYVAGEFVFYHQTRPIENQNIAFRGFIITDNSAAGFASGQREGSFAPALRANDLTPETYEPGWKAIAGYRFRNGATVEFSWLHLSEAKYSGGATFATPFFKTDPLLADTFLFSPVYNFPNEFSGPDTKALSPVDGVTPLNLSGIWNGASIMQIQFTQRFDEYDMTGRIPMFLTENTRTYGLIGPRLTWIWDRFRWRTVSEDVNTGLAGSDDVAIYSNVVSNRMYGVHCGCGTEWRLGDTPIGTFATNLDLQVALFADVVKEDEKYERGDHFTSAKMSRSVVTAVPELQGTLALTYYPPFQGIQVRVGYDIEAFFNTVSAPDPVSFNLGKLDNQYEAGTFRLLNGFNAGIGFSF